MGYFETRKHIRKSTEESLCPIHPPSLLSKGLDGGPGEKKEINSAPLLNSHRTLSKWPFQGGPHHLSSPAVLSPPTEEQEIFNLHCHACSLIFLADGRQNARGFFLFCKSKHCPPLPPDRTLLRSSALVPSCSGNASPPLASSIIALFPSCLICPGRPSSQTKSITPGSDLCSLVVPAWMIQLLLSVG